MEPDERPECPRCGRARPDLHAWTPLGPTTGALNCRRPGGLVYLLTRGDAAAGEAR